MSTVVARASGGGIRLTEEFRRSGEGVIWRTEDNNLLAKLYHDTGHEERYRPKLEAMIKRPPRDPLAGTGHHGLAWPVDLLLDGSGRCLGFLMPAIPDAVTLINIANPALRKKHTGFNWRYLHQAARNIAAIFDCVHRRGYVMGDVKDANILVNRQALPALVDCDSFQVRTLTKRFHCPVGTAGYTPRECIGLNFAEKPRQRSADRFGLAVLIHLLLLGDSPFTGRWSGAGDPPDINDLILHGHHRHRRGSPIKTVPRCVPLRTLNRRLRRLMRRALTRGHRKPRKRPSARTWFKALDHAGKRLVICSVNPWHYYDVSNRKCPWCQHLERTGSDAHPLPAGADTEALRRDAEPHNTAVRAAWRREVRLLWLFRLVALGLIAGSIWWFWPDIHEWVMAGKDWMMGLLTQQ
jgi:DNA-binding helix-hairpin-helix protein with protein kinase domain